MLKSDAFTSELKFFTCYNDPHGLDQLENIRQWKTNGKQAYGHEKCCHVLRENSSKDYQQAHIKIYLRGSFSELSKLRVFEGI